MVTTSRRDATEDLAPIRRRLVATASHKVASADAEDVAQEALIRAWNEEPRPGAPPFSIRAQKKLKDVNAEYHRSRARRPEETALPSDDETAPEIGREDAKLEVVELLDMVRNVAGADVVEYVQQKAVGRTNEEIAEYLGWSKQRVEAARKQRDRKLAKMLEHYEKGRRA